MVTVLVLVALIIMCMHHGLQLTSRFCNQGEINNVLNVLDVCGAQCLLWIYDKNSPIVVVYSILQPPGVILSGSLRTLSMKQLKTSGKPCLTPLTTLNSSDAPTVVLTWHHVLVYISLMISTR